ncbi:unnamed protein product [Polarella glacialis]|uniref:Uncharacterized protein n=1 Tax=Polarella glacialis TaxID=89957 RepID=A0A813DXK8_POLGL|nr:unnamed protein product [Polarella glacialis]
MDCFSRVWLMMSGCFVLVGICVAVYGATTIQNAEASDYNPATCTRVKELGPTCTRSSGRRRVSCSWSCTYTMHSDVPGATDHDAPGGANNDSCTQFSCTSNSAFNCTTGCTSVVQDGEEVRLTFTSQAAEVTGGVLLLCFGLLFCCIASCFFCCGLGTGMGREPPGSSDSDSA